MKTRIMKPETDLGQLVQAGAVTISLDGFQATANAQQPAAAAS